MDLDAILLWITPPAKGIVILFLLVPLYDGHIASCFMDLEVILFNHH